MMLNVFLDVGGVLLLPNPTDTFDPESSERMTRAHYEGVRAFDRSGSMDAYRSAYREWLPSHLDQDLEWDRSWTEPVPWAADFLATIRPSARRIVLVSDSNGTIEQQVQLAGLCSVAGHRGGIAIDAVVDSEIVGFRKPHPSMFETALAKAGAKATDVVHVGDSVRCDVAGAIGVGIEAVHFDPYELCDGCRGSHASTLGGVAGLLDEFGRGLQTV